MKYIFFLLFLTACKNRTSQSDKVIGGGCDGCELMYIGMPKKINEVDTSVAWDDSTTKLLVEGTVYDFDGITPARNVVIYYWHTNKNGRYEPDPAQDERAQRHGAIRGWIKTNKSGHYKLYTTSPAPYPNNHEPAHIHISIKEPEIKDEYYIDALIFDDDTLLTQEIRDNKKNRGGSGILKLQKQGNMFTVQHDIFLGKNIPNYPAK